MQKTFKRNLNSLEEIFDFVNEFIADYKLDDTASYTINLAVEELFTNMVKYGQNTKNDIQIELNKENNDLVISLTDYDVEPFDITKAKDVDVGQHLGERKVGGLGIHLVKKMMDEVNYEYKNRTSKITLIKHLEN
ncbi:ATP-binding protein [candidate division KSB1 bacterium]|nr:ATP-binding protein [candidate division KSB1 bacterium]NIR69077.1 ATP-binding protein [candidate division KSB1 bacterium]NIS25639.1 ATP-binding protein [candidate division KSB1 bacterium]NIT72503.1 ATP-binding protein [candidate division KSB1 bacterium]NIU26316.1 ATP-binding protein [candidate division KSB1 bacterium]